MIKAVGEGTATITALTADGKHSAAAEITVTKAPAPIDDNKDDNKDDENKKPDPVNEEETNTKNPDTNTNTDNNETPNNESNDQTENTETSNNELPDTATNHYQFLLWGLVIIVAGGVLFIGYKRKKINE
jgi:LPXTG-motif cell wall-anchored protein